MRGVVHGLPRLCVSIRGKSKRFQGVETIIDTGFDGWISLPYDVVNALDLPRIGEGDGTLADGTESKFDIYAATVRWHRRNRKAWVYAIGGIALIGMSLLEGSDFNMKVRQGGAITIKPLRRPRG